MSSTGFAHYRDASSSSLTTGSGSSLASSTGGLHMNVPMTSLTPIPVMITSPDGSLRRESMQSGQTEMKPPIFYTHNEVIIPPSSPFSYNSRLSYSHNSNFERKSLSILSQYLEKGTLYVSHNLGSPSFWTTSILRAVRKTIPGIRRTTTACWRI